MIDYTDLNYQDWVDWLNKNGEKPFHAKQIIEFSKRGVKLAGNV